MEYEKAGVCLKAVPPSNIVLARSVKGQKLTCRQNIDCSTVDEQWFMKEDLRKEPPDRLSAGSNPYSSCQRPSDLNASAAIAWASHRGLQYV